MKKYFKRIIERLHMVRTDTKENAAHLEEIYQKYTSLRLKKIDSSMSHITIKKYLSDLHSGQLDGIICVDMLGEGYDFPNLKIAAVHAPHKSLASTLQFTRLYNFMNDIPVAEPAVSIH